MSGNTLNVNSVLQCPHGGSVQIITANARVKVDNAFAALATDQFIISGCPFQIPIGTGTKPQPCVVATLAPAPRILINGVAAVVNVGPSVCRSAEQIPQGPASVTVVQTRVSTL